MGNERSKVGRGQIAKALMPLKELRHSFCSSLSTLIRKHNKKIWKVSFSWDLRVWHWPGVQEAAWPLVLTGLEYGAFRANQEGPFSPLGLRS